MTARKPGPCLYPGTERCGKYWAYTSLGCRAEPCREAARIAKKAARGSDLRTLDARLLEDRPTATVGLRVIDRNAAHPARARWAALIARIDREEQR